MFGAFDSHPMFHDPQRGDPYRELEYPQRRRENSASALELDRHGDLLREAEYYRLVRRLPQRPSWASQAWSRAQLFLGVLACRVRTYAFRRPCPEPAV